MSKQKPYIEPPRHIQAFALCVDASNPPKDVHDWISESKMYRVLGLRPALNVKDEMSIILADEHGVEMQPTRSMGGYRESRFKLIEIILN